VNKDLYIITAAATRIYQVVGGGEGVVVVEEAVVRGVERGVAVERAAGEQPATLRRLVDTRPSTDDVRRRRRRHGRRGDAVAFTHEPRTAIDVDHVRVLLEHIGRLRTTLVRLLVNSAALLRPAPAIYHIDLNF